MAKVVLSDNEGAALALHFGEFARVADAATRAAASAVAPQLGDLARTVDLWQAQVARILELVVLWRGQLARTLELLASPAWQQMVFQVLHEFDMTDAEPSTWWLELPLQVRTGIIGCVVWTYIFVLFSTLSLEYQAEAAILRENTGLNPVEISVAVSCLASMVYRHFARPDES